MTTAEAKQLRAALLDMWRPVVADTAARVVAGTDPDRVVVLVDTGDTSGGNMADAMADGVLPDEWAEVCPRVRLGVIKRPRLVSYLQIVWPAVAGTVAALEHAAPAGHVFVWVVAAGGCQLVRMNPKNECGGNDAKSARKPLSPADIAADQWHHESTSPATRAVDACRADLEVEGTR
jgi:hypothetical protein